MQRVSLIFVEKKKNWESRHTFEKLKIILKRLIYAEVRDSQTNILIFHERNVSRNKMGEVLSFKEFEIDRTTVFVYQTEKSN